MFPHGTQLLLNPLLERRPQKSDYWVITTNIAMTWDPNYYLIFGEVEPVYVLTGCRRSLVPNPHGRARFRLRLRWLIV